MKKPSVLIILALLISSSIFAQTQAKKGNYKFLKGESSLNIQYEYSDMTVGKNLTEEEYVNENVAERNEDEAGKGDKWKEGWISSRNDRYEPKFESLLNKSMEKTGITATEDSDSKYTLIVKTTYTEPGFNIGVMKKPAYVNYELTFIETETEKEVANYILEKVPGSQAMGGDFDVGSRIAESYAKSGKMLGSYIAKNLK